jgi:hypothetical protein
MRAITTLDLDFSEGIAVTIQKPHEFDHHTLVETLVLRALFLLLGMMPSGFVQFDAALPVSNHTMTSISPAVEFVSLLLKSNNVTMGMDPDFSCSIPMVGREF